MKIFCGIEKTGIKKEPTNALMSRDVTATLGCYRTQHFSVVVVHTSTLPFFCTRTQNILFKCLLIPKNFKKLEKKISKKRIFFFWKSFFHFFWVRYHWNSTFRCADNCAGAVIFGDTVRCVDNNHNNSCCPHIVVVR